ncbi:DUF2157 domain-containing protein [Pseudaminobacter soli (ex Li et al. 2025)]|uniref:DUF2157 domain-containing protein n=1 Tax=Pseudaminobacter soli (ex Li et al. 2025) TaxID=1295366 RepID=UPI003159D677
MSALAGYSARVKQDIARWVDRGLIDASTGDALARDLEANESRLFSFGFVLAVMAALLLGAALLLLVAANWDAIPRLLRVIGLFAIIFATYVGGAVLKSRGQNALAEALWLVGAAAFGGSIALIGQMYHLEGDESAALLTWCFGTGLAALLLRSGLLTVAAAAIGIAWMVVVGFDDWEFRHSTHFYLLIAAALWLISYWTRSRAARHLILLSLVFYACLLVAHYNVSDVGIGLALVSTALFALCVAVPAAVEAIFRIDSLLPVHCLIGFLTGMLLIQVDQLDYTGRLVMSALVVFAGIAVALYFTGRDSRLLRWIAYAGFGLELCFVYVLTIGTMLGTAGLFFASGIVLGIIAIVIIRVERRIGGGAIKQAGAA